MGVTTDIAWTDHTFNPWHGCTRVSPGCEHCYAEAFDKRTGHASWGKNAERRFFGAKHWAEPIAWDRKAGERGVRERVFCASMADVFEDRADLNESREELWSLIEITPNLDWQLLTKRPENVLRLVDPDWLNPGYWPANCWVGATVEDQVRADLRVSILRTIPAPVRFLSCEPLLGDLDIDFSGIDWVIIGGESGPKRRTMQLGWMLDVVEQARGGPAVFIKQDSALRSGTQGRIPDWLWEFKQFPS